MRPLRLYVFPHVDGALKPCDMAKQSHYLVLAESAEQARANLAHHRGRMDVRDVPAPEAVRTNVLFITCDGRDLL